MIKIAIVEDSAELAQAEEKYIRSGWSFDEEIEIEHFDTGERFMESHIEEFDILFSDIQLPGIDGLKMVKWLREKGSGMLVVFLTAHSKYAVNSYRLEAEQYIMKCEMEKRLPKVIKNLGERIIQGRRMCIILQDEEIVRKIFCSEILYLKKDGKYVTYVTADRELRQRKGLEEAFREIGEGFPFVRIERGFVVNMWHVMTVAEDTVIMDNGEYLPMSRRMRASVKSEFIKCGLKS